MKRAFSFVAFSGLAVLMLVGGAIGCSKSKTKPVGAPGAPADQTVVPSGNQAPPPPSNNAPKTDLEGTWVGTCQQASGSNFPFQSSQEVLEIVGNQVTDYYKLSQNGDCSADGFGAVGGTQTYTFTIDQPANGGTGQVTWHMASGDVPDIYSVTNSQVFFGSFYSVDGSGRPTQLDTSNPFSKQ